MKKILAAALFTLCLINFACSGSTDDTSTNTYIYNLPSDSPSLYPNAYWLPEAYKQYYPDLATTIMSFTQQSLKNDGLDGSITVQSVTIDDNGVPQVVLSGADTRTMHNFADMHVRFLSQDYASQGLNGVNYCKETNGCWDPHPKANNPWAFFLPLGLPLVNQVAVTFLNYPPNDSLKSGDYLNNFTMKRWNQVYESVGIANPILYDTIVDARPIAAPGSGQASYMPDINIYFNNKEENCYYDTPMLTLLTKPPSNTASKNSLPVIILGTPSRQAWASIINVNEVNVLDVGTSTLPGATKPTNWVASNHPDVTTYNCCPGDTNPNCCDGDSGCSYDLIENERIDLQAACIIQLLANSDISPEDAKSLCSLNWASDNMPTKNQQTLCVRAKLDYDYTTDGQCSSPEEALAFCTYYENNACPRDIYTCEIPYE